MRDWLGWAALLMLRLPPGGGARDRGSLGLAVSDRATRRAPLPNGAADGGGGSGRSSEAGDWSARGVSDDDLGTGSVPAAAGPVRTSTLWDRTWLLGRAASVSAAPSGNGSTVGGCSDLLGSVRDTSSSSSVSMWVVSTLSCARPLGVCAQARTVVHLGDQAEPRHRAVFVHTHHAATRRPRRRRPSLRRAARRRRRRTKRPKNRCVCSGRPIVRLHARVRVGARAHGPSARLLLLMDPP
jgi:hypothetical protein